MLRSQYWGLQKTKQIRMSQFDYEYMQGLNFTSMNDIKSHIEA